MTDNLKQFIKLISEDKDLQEKIGKLDKDEEKVKKFILAEAKERGIQLTEEDFSSTEELSKDEMEAICGSGGCGCMLVGGGGGDGLACKCTPAQGTGYVDHRSGICSQGGCICFVAGAGATRRH